MKLFTSVVKEPMGNGNLTSKVHWLLHICKYIDEYGPPKVYCGQTPERVLSPLVKWAARHTQLRPSTIIEQSCERYYENIVIERCHSLLQYQNIIGRKEKVNRKSNHLMNLSCVTNSRQFMAIGNYAITISNDGKLNEIKWKNSKKNLNQTIMYNKKLLQDIIDRLKKDDFDLRSNYLNCFTTLHICDHELKMNQSFP